LAGFFLICFLFGIALSFLTFLTGAAHISLPGAHALHLGHHLLLPGGHSTGHETASPLNLGSLLAFLTWFGGVGYVLFTLSPLALLGVILLSLLAGVAGGALILVFVAKVLLPAQTSVDPEAYRLDGTPARVTAGIPAHGTGEITYSKAGTRRSDAARSINGIAMVHGEEVVILAYRHGIAYVQSLKEYLSSSATAIAAQLMALDSDATSGDLSSHAAGEGVAKGPADPR